jgi:hypothetical protein
MRSVCRNELRHTEVGALELAMAYIASALCAFAVVVGGLLMLAIYPLAGVLLTLGGLALLLYALTNLCGIPDEGKQ